MNANIYTQNTEMNNWVSRFANHFTQIEISNIYIKLLIFYQDTFCLTTTIFVQNSIFVFIFLKKLSFTTLTWLKTTQLNNDAFPLKSIKKFTFCVKSSDSILFLLGFSPINLTGKYNLLLLLFWQQLTPNFHFLGTNKVQI